MRLKRDMKSTRRDRFYLNAFSVSCGYAAPTALSTHRWISFTFCSNIPRALSVVGSVLAAVEASAMLVQFINEDCLT